MLHHLLISHTYVFISSSFPSLLRKTELIALFGHVVCVRRMPRLDRRGRNQLRVPYKRSRTDSKHMRNVYWDSARRHNCRAAVDQLAMDSVGTLALSLSLPQTVLIIMYACRCRCTANGTVASTPNTTTSGLGNNAGNSNKNGAGASASSDNKTGGAMRGATAATSSAIALVMAAGLAVLAL